MMWDSTRREGIARHHSGAWWRAVAAAATASFVGLAAAADAGPDDARADAPTVTPYRPSVSTPAALSAPGWLELEVGGTHEWSRGLARRDSVPYTLKLAFSEDWGVRIGGDAVIRSRDDGGARTSGVGDTGVVVKRRFAMSDASAFGLELGATAPTAKAGLGAGKADYAVNGIFSSDVDRFHVDLNLVLTRLGSPEPGASRRQVSWAAAASTSLSDRWGVVGELSGTDQRGSDATAQLLVAASYGVSRSLSLDAGVARSFRAGSRGWSAFAGLTALVGRLF